MMREHFSPFSKKGELLIKIGVGVLLFLVVGGVILYRYFYEEESMNETSNSSVIVMDENKTEKEEIEKVEEIEEKQEEEKEIWMVDIKGEVVKTGTYQVTEEMRVIDVINLAGGLTDVADTTLLNLSQKVKDQMVIIIYSKEEVQNMKNVIKMREELLANCKNGTIINDACIKEEEEVSEESTVLININTASKEELSKLSGIGEKKADAIIEYRNTNGLFQTLEDIMKVSGIGESVYDAIKDQITIGS